MNEMYDVCLTIVAIVSQA